VAILHNFTQGRNYWWLPWLGEGISDELVAVGRAGGRLGSHSDAASTQQ